MQNQKEIKGKIRAVQSIKKVTKAMEAISNIRLKKAMKAAQSSRDYSENLLFFVGQIIKTIDSDENHLSTLIETRPIKSSLFVILSSDKGLCGVFNSRLLLNVMKAASQEKSKGTNIEMITVGRKAFDFFKRRGFKIIKNYSGISQDAKVEQGYDLVNDCVSSFENGLIDNVYIFYNHFISIAKQEVSSFKLLPIDLEVKKEPPHFPRRILGLFEEGKEFKFPEFIFEPDKAGIISSLIKRYLEAITLQMLLESCASEHAARLVAMQQSIINADEMILDLTMLYNKARQALITRELIEIISGAEALA